MKNLINDNMKRVFIAIEFKENIKSYLYDIQNIVIKDSEKGNFTTKENFHLTLKFIGETKVDILEKIEECIDKVALDQSNFSLYFDKLGQFPGGNKSIVWIGLKSSNELHKLYEDLEMQLEEIGIERESRKFTPHITIGRQVILNEEFNKLAERINIDTSDILVHKISLMESIRVGGELKYIPIYVRDFK